MNYSQYELLGQ